MKRNKNSIEPSWHRAQPEHHERPGHVVKGRMLEN